jgi:DNA (cytosine-5)-methyltransferase 1
VRLIIREQEINMSMTENALYKVLENHPNDSRVKIREDNIFQSLTSRMGTGGGQRANDFRR